MLAHFGGLGAELPVADGLPVGPGRVLPGALEQSVVRARPVPWHIGSGKPMPARNHFSHLDDQGCRRTLGKLEREAAKRLARERSYSIRVHTLVGRLRFTKRMVRPDDYRSPTIRYTSYRQERSMIDNRLGSVIRDHDRDREWNMGVATALKEERTEQHGQGRRDRCPPPHMKIILW
jgi:hypothetical protein